MSIERLACDLKTYPAASANGLEDNVIVLHQMLPNDRLCKWLEMQTGIWCMAQITRGNYLKEVFL